jgi:hypothetical protein
MAIVRDLMKPIYNFGCHDAPDQFVIHLDEARRKLRQGEDFYIRAGNDVYQVSPSFYRSVGISQQAIEQRLKRLLVPPEAMGL